MGSPRVSYRIEGAFFIISFTDPRYLNSLSFDDFIYISELLEKADKDDSILYTVFQSSGKFFSAGFKFDSIAEFGEIKKEKNPLRQLSLLFGTISSQNVLVADRFLKHRKILICCLNGPAIGLGAALVMLCDIVYSMTDSVYLLFPFSNLAFVTELSSSITVARKLGHSCANEHLMFSTPITYNELFDKKVIVRNYKMDDTDEFNKKVIADLQKQAKQLHPDSIIGIKNTIMTGEYGRLLKLSQANESTTTFPFWVDGHPQKRFQQMKNKERRHKL
ncbi:hypothetical protein Kpol_345p4 [Vanderwaltozyma polyspora DSM 70294]|uniref:Uncharacterized protein n=1 Tax=Vanderwaltozyma polyspora (strain ATCC 22028 / DSM 70294 / BCRC 21397 / CBS 2163 / NBRC 10782 / NRRL Y-8283 / UCD 57-17) TaxID=436907 RepID=A7TS99_VANPO|nr:uncharacterized protein Kpol_345p4 [Vanderwaltozyma polyspora DSM 70294]EDO14856.1 hypothetical protein Kpol_345p4 [Vanderwaltozyma polyspora DSM 70294]